MTQAQPALMTILKRLGLILLQVTGFASEFHAFVQWLRLLRLAVDRIADNLLTLARCQTVVGDLDVVFVGLLNLLKQLAALFKPVIIVLESDCIVRVLFTTDIS